MSTLVIRAPAVAKLSAPLRGFVRAAAMIAVLLDAFNEAQREVYAAKQRYPFTAW